MALSRSTRMSLVGTPHMRVREGSFGGRACVGRGP